MSTTVVVGGAKGIGQAIAEHLAHAAPQDSYVVADICAESAERVAAGLRAEGIDVSSVELDLRRPESVQALVSKTAVADKVAIAAGVFASASSLEAPREQFDEILQVNLTGCFQAAQLYAAEMVRNGGGAIVAITSIAARMPRLRQAAYSASKAGLRQALRVLGMEVAGEGVRINCVSPGPTDSDMMRQMAKDHGGVDHLAQGSPEAFRPRIPVGRVAQGTDIASAVEFLLSPASSHILLADLVVDGGELLGM